MIRSYPVTAMAIVLTATLAAGDSHFLHVRKDAQGRYLWQYPENWSHGKVPDSSTPVEIGEDSSREARHCVIKSDAHCRGMQLAEHARTEGSSLWITRGSKLTIHGSDSVLSKDRESFTTIDGELDSSRVNSTFRVGGFWGQPMKGLPCSAHVYVNATGSIRCWFLGLNTSHRGNNAPSAPWGPKYWGRATDSEIIVDGGKVYAQEGVRMSTVIASRPGKLILKGKASLTMGSDPQYGFQMWCGIWEIEGGNANVQIGKLELWGNKYKDEVNGKYGWPVGPGVSVLKFSGDGVSTINANGVADFVDAAQVDVSDLDVPNGTYTLVNATALKRTNLQLAPGTDTNIWSLRFDAANGNVLLIRKAGAAATERRYDKMKGVETNKHPYLFFSAKDLPEMRRRIKQKPASFFFEQLQSSARRLDPKQLSLNGQMPVYRTRVQARHMEAAALHYLLTGDTTSRDAAKAGLIGLGNWMDMGERWNMTHGGLIRMTAIVYDWLYGELSNAERKQVETMLATGTSRLMEMGKTLWWGTGKPIRQGNFQPQMYSAVAMTGLVLKGKHPEAEGWIRLGTQAMKETLDEEFDAEGGSYETLARYALGVSLGSVYPTAEALRRVTGEDLYVYRDSLLSKTTAFTAYMLHPQLNGMAPFGDTYDDLHAVGQHLVRNASEYGDGVAAWYVDRLIAEGWKPGNDHEVWGTLWSLPIKPQNPDTSPKLPKSRVYNFKGKGKLNFGCGYVFLRSDFSRKDGIQFVCPVISDAGFHGHADKGSYVINAYGLRFLRDYFEGSYSGERFKYLHSGEAHHTVLIDGVGQGAQETGIVDSQYYMKVAEIEAFQPGEQYDYVRMNLTRAYQANPANKTTRNAMRHIVFVRTSGKTGYFVVVDDVQKDDLPHEYSHAFHYHNKDVKVDSLEGGRFVLAGEGARMIVQAACPASGLEGRKMEKFGDTYVLLTAKEKTPRFVMMTVLHPVRTGQADPKIISTADDGIVRVSIDGVRIAYDQARGEVSVRLPAKKGE